MPELTPVRLRLLWFPQAQFAGYLLAQHRGIAAAHGIALECVPIDFTLGPIDAVLSGDCDLAVASPAHLVESKAPADLVLLLAVQQASSLVYGARRDAGIATFADLRGKRIGVWPGGEDLELRWALQRSGVAGDAVTFVPVNDTAAALANGDVDAAQLTTYHEIFELEHHVHDLAPFVFLTAVDADAALLKDGLIARRDWLAGNARVAQAVIDSVLAGWTAAFADPSETIALCMELRPDLSREHHEQQLAAIRALAFTGATLTEGSRFSRSAPHARCRHGTARDARPRGVARRRRRRRPPLLERRTAVNARRTIAVIGAGVVGAAIARALAERGHAVELLEQGDPAFGVSGASLSCIGTHMTDSDELPLLIWACEAWGASRRACEHRVPPLRTTPLHRYARRTYRRRSVHCDRTRGGPRTATAR